jgi:hypothetical protein
MCGFEAMAITPRCLVNAMSDVRDHLFISYAAEDVTFAEWLARRLALEGYAVWMDRLKMLGGESWPRDIQDAIRSRAFRMLAVVSRSSLNKPAPLRERTFAQRLAGTLGIPDFLIPLSLDGLSREELQWTLSDTCDIPFDPSWATGLAQLLKKLESIDAPKSLTGGAGLAARSFAGEQHLAADGETLVSNCLSVTHVPEAILRFRLADELTLDEYHQVKLKWPVHRVSPTRVLSFDCPPGDVADKLGARSAGGAAWRHVGRDSLFDIEPRTAVVSLIHKCIDHLFSTKGFVFCTNRKRWYIPDGLLPGSRMKYTRPDGYGSHIDAIGQRKFRQSHYRHHLSPGLSVVPGSCDPFLLYMRNRVYLTDTHNVPYAGRSVNARRKDLCRNWWNENWLARTLAKINEPVAKLGKLR